MESFDIIINKGLTEKLFQLWEDAHCDEPDTGYLNSNIPKDIFLPDGIIEQEKFKASKRKVLFVAKEANWFRSDSEISANKSAASMFWHRKVAFGEVDKTNFSYRLALLANAIMSADTNNYSVVDKSHDVLQSVAVINLNKRGGYSYCVWDTLNTYVRKYQDFIRKQIELIKPDLIVCCGYDVKWLFDEYMLAPTDSDVIWVYHPSYFAISDEEYLRQLKCAMLGEKWSPVCKYKASVKPTKRAVRGIIFDTNKTYSSTSTMDMLLSNKVSAYGDASRLIDSFDVGDYVFFSVKGVGIVAAGRIISETQEKKYPDGICEKFRVVDFITPAADMIPHGEDGLKGLSWNDVVSVLGHNFFKARTDKRPYLSETECELIVEALGKVNNQSGHCVQ